MMIWNASGVPVWQVAFVWAGVILFWGLVIWAGYAHITRRRYRRWRPRWEAGRVNGHRGARGGGSYRHRLNERHVRHPQCTGGRRAGPPEDWDGPRAYLVPHPSAGTADSVTSGSFA
jgi:hypothetical protein